MVKHEIKIELTNTTELSELIKKAYFIEGDSGKILKKKYFVTIEPENDIDYSILKGMDGATIKVHNDNVIDGSMRFMVEENEGKIKLFPISIYAVKSNDLYSFY
jgi:F0F1-type ATP synthase delta subunit